MCQCTPEIRTPWCGRGTCVPTALPPAPPALTAKLQQAQQALTRQRQVLAQLQAQYTQAEAQALRLEGAVQVLQELERDAGSGKPEERHESGE
jgi:multidrug resistance efflux pump